VSGKSTGAAASGAAPGHFGLGDAIVLGLSSSGPAQTLAVSLASLVAVCHYGGVVPLLVCFVPMVGIAIGYQRLNRWDQSAGATYTWVAKVFHPYLGFLAGWMILLYYTLGTISLTIPAGTYTLELLAPGLGESHLAIVVAGGAWNVIVTLLALKGLNVAARFDRHLFEQRQCKVLELGDLAARRARQRTERRHCRAEQPFGLSGFRSNRDLPEIRR